jgi:hypothetical protein
MPGTFSDSWKLTKTAFRLIAEDRALLVFPVVAGLSILGVIALLILGWVWVAWPLATTQGGFQLNGTFYAVAIALFVAAYFAMVFLSVYCTAALVGAATLKLSGQQPTAADGWRIARARLGRLFLWSVIAATVGLVIQLVASRVRGVGGAVIRIVGGVAWSVVTYFMVPVIIYEDLGAWKSLARSAHLFTSTLGRTLVSNIVVGLMIAAGVVAALVLGIAGLFVLVGGSVVLGVLLIGVGIAVAVIVALIGAAAEGILRAALYRYATTGKIDPDLLPSGYAVPRF